ncbi:MAG: dihydrodipicolinate synthase family protein [Proteobacteria bacterium]|nr:dihydrodipicolinate synthase family protein [Pseudomonadota bacterium]
MNNGKVGWRGNFPAVITPFTCSGGIDEGKFVDNLELMISEGIHGIVVAGCNGESWALKGEERLRLFRLAVETARGRVPVIGGTSGIVTDDVTELSRAAREVGCAGVMITPPYYAMINLEETYAHYKAVSDGAKVPILIYHHPRRTGVFLAPRFLERLAEIEYVVAVKESHGDFANLEDTLSAVGDRILVFSGRSAERGVAAVLMGCPGYVGSMEPHAMGREGNALFELAAGGRIEEANRLQLRIRALDKALHEIGTAPASLKAAMNLLGRPGGHVRRPLLDLTPAEVGEVRAILERFGLFQSAARRSAA